MLLRCLADSGDSTFFRAPFAENDGTVLHFLPLLEYFLTIFNTEAPNQLVRLASYHLRAHSVLRLLHLTS